MDDIELPVREVREAPRGGADGPTRRKYEMRQREVIDTAAKVFDEKGFHGASTRDIADRLGMRQASLYYYFKDKEEALAKVCEQGVEGYVARLEEVVAADLPITEKFRLMVRRHLEPVAERPAHSRVFLNQRRLLSKPYRQRISKLTHRYNHLVEGILRDGVASGVLRADLDCRLAALLAIGMCNGASQWLGHEPDQPFDKVVSTVADHFLLGVVSRASPRLDESKKKRKTPPG